MPPRLRLPRLPATPQQSLNKYDPPAIPSVKSTETFTRIYTYFTEAGDTRLLYSAQSWVQARLTLENAGPVSVGSDQNLVPVLSGKGILLPTNVEIEFYLSKGTRLYIAAEGVNRVKFIISPLPPGFLYTGH
jgi:hypothetical protein